MTRCSLVLTNLNGVQNENLPRFLPRIVEACAAGNQIEEIVLVDDGSTDDSCEFVRSQFPSVRLISLSPNRGFSVAANAGFEACSNNLVALLSNDMVPHTNWLDFLVPHFDDPDLFAVTARLVYEDGRPQSHRRAVEMKWGRLKRVRSKGGEPSEDDAANALFYHAGDAWSLYDREKFLQLGGFDAELFLPCFSEDEDLFYRAWKRGWKVTYEPRSHVVHHHEQSTIFRAFSDADRERMYRGHQFLYTWKNLTDPKLRLKHFSSLALRCAISWIADRGFYTAFSYALRRRHRIHRQTNDAGPPLLSDIEVMTRMLEFTPVTRGLTHRSSEEVHSRPARASTR